MAKNSSKSAAPAVAEMNEEDTAMSNTATAARPFRITAEDVAATATTARKGKETNPDSGRQRILQVLKASEVPLSPSQIGVFVKTIFGQEMKWVSSHLDYFRKQGQVVQVEKGKYILAQEMRDRVADIPQD